MTYCETPTYTAPIDKHLVSRILSERVDPLDNWIMENLRIEIDLRSFSSENMTWATRQNVFPDTDYLMTAEKYWKEVTGFVPKTSLGKELLEIRKRVLASKIRLLTWDEISDEMKKRRRHY